MEHHIEESRFTQQVLDSIQLIEKIESRTSLVEDSGGLGAFPFSLTAEAACGAAVSPSSWFGFGDTSTVTLGVSEESKEIEENKKILDAFDVATKELFQISQQQGQQQQYVKIRYFESSEPHKLKKFIKEKLCPHIQGLSDDVFEVAKVTTPVLLSLSAAGTITLPMQPMIFAAAATLLVRRGIAILCQ